MCLQNNFTEYRWQTKEEVVISWQIKTKKGYINEDIALIFLAKYLKPKL